MNRRRVESKRALRIPGLLVFVLLLAAAVFLLWAEHKAHIIGLLPFALLLLCPVVHLFMHHGHSHGDPASGTSHGREPHLTAGGNNEH